MRQRSVSAWSNSNIISAYAESIAYDANGNITKYLRRGANTAGNPLDMDSLSYKYNWGADGKLINNQLNYVKDTVSATNYSVDIDNQSPNNYIYDHIGNLKKDAAERIDTIRWTVYGKINRIVKNGNSLRINYGYDLGGNRTTKVVSGAADTTTFYVRDAQGNVLAIYTKKGSNALQSNEQDLYGSSRIGLWRWDTIVPASPPIAVSGSPIQDSLMIGARNYELTNHLGNVLSTISDKKIGHDSSGVVNYYIAEVLSQNDYYPFGMLMPGRKYEATSSYRYGFQGQEKDNEIKGDGNSIDFSYRIYDTRLGKFLSVDPLSKVYPFYSPYHFSSNQPIHAPELDGMESSFDLNIPNSPNEVDLNHWTLNTQHKAPNSTQWIDANGNRLTFDKGQAGKPKFGGKDHWHFEDVNGNRYNAEGAIAKSYGAKEAHLMPGTKTSIKVQASVTSTEINGLSNTTTKSTPTAEERPSNVNGKTLKAMIIVDVVTTVTGIATGDPDAMINWYGSAKVGELKSGALKIDNPILRDPALDDANYYMITDEQVSQWSENGTKYKTVTRYLQHYESKTYDKKTKRYVGADPVGPVYQQTQKFQNGKLIDKGQLTSSKMIL
jgi:RHS repeat-associated protein